MTCKHCGKEVSPDDKICPHCHEDLVKNAGRRSSSTAAKIVVGCAFAIAGVFVIGIFAAVAIPKFANTKEKAYVASMRSDLRDLRARENAYFDAHNRFTDDTAIVKATGSNAIKLTLVSDSFWSATASNPNTAITCMDAMKIGLTPSIGDSALACADLTKRR